MLIMDVDGGPVTFDVEGGQVDILKSGSGSGPAEKLEGILVAHIDATMAHGIAEIIMPIGAMEAVPSEFGNLIVIKKFDVGDVRQVIICAD